MYNHFHYRILHFGGGGGKETISLITAFADIGIVSHKTQRHEIIDSIAFDSCNTAR